VRKKPARPARKGLLGYLRGSTTISLVLAVIILGSLLFVGSIAPREGEVTNPPKQGILDPTLDTTEKRSLQLETLKFKECAETVAIDFLVDNSGSMEYGDKLVELKKGLVTFSSNFPDTGIIGLQAYSSPASRPPVGYHELVPIDLFKNVKSNFVSAVSSMRPAGATYSKDAMTFAKQKLDAARARFPDYQFNLVFISDGIPETEATEAALCPGGIPNSDLCSVSTNPLTGQADCRCFAQVQDPTSVASQIKNSGVRIFTISYLDALDEKFNDRLQDLMKGVASSISDYYQAPVENQITTILSQIAQKSCEKL
jgi:hypothetical protein